MASGGTLTNSTGWTDHCSCTANQTGAFSVTAAFSARRVPVSSGLNSEIEPASTSDVGESSERRLSRNLNTCVSLNVASSCVAKFAITGAGIMRVSPVCSPADSRGVSLSAASTSRTLELGNDDFAPGFEPDLDIGPDFEWGAGADLAAGRLYPGRAPLRTVPPGMICAPADEADAGVLVRAFAAG